MRNGVCGVLVGATVAHASDVWEEIESKSNFSAGWNMVCRFSCYSYVRNGVQGNFADRRSRTDGLQLPGFYHYCLRVTLNDHSGRMLLGLGWSLNLSGHDFHGGYHPSEVPVRRGFDPYPAEMQNSKADVEDGPSCVIYKVLEEQLILLVLKSLPVFLFDYRAVLSYDLLVLLGFLALA